MSIFQQTVAALLVFGLVACAGLAFSAENGAPGDAKAASAALSIGDMETPACSALVKKAVSKVDGVFTINTDLDAKTALVEYNPQKTDVGAIQKVIKEQTGFEAEAAGRH